MWAYGDAILIQTTITIKINPHFIFIFWCFSSSGGIKFNFTTLIVVLSLLSLLFKLSFRVLISDLAFPSLVSLFLNRQSHSVTYMVWNSLCCPGWLQPHGSPLSSACQLVRMHMWIYHAWIHIDSCDSLTNLYLSQGIRGDFSLVVFILNCPCQDSALQRQFYQLVWTGYWMR